jgi:hypothetical protein
MRRRQEGRGGNTSRARRLARPSSVAPLQESPQSARTATRQGAGDEPRPHSQCAAGAYLPARIAGCTRHCGWSRVGSVTSPRQSASSKSGYAGCPPCSCRVLENCPHWQRASEAIRQARRPPCGCGTDACQNIPGQRPRRSSAPCRGGASIAPLAADSGAPRLSAVPPARLLKTGSAGAPTAAVPPPAAALPVD